MCKLSFQFQTFKDMDKKCVMLIINLNLQMNFKWSHYISWNVEHNKLCNYLLKFFVDARRLYFSNNYMSPIKDCILGDGGSPIGTISPPSSIVVVMKTSSTFATSVLEWASFCKTILVFKVIKKEYLSLIWKNDKCHQQPMLKIDNKEPNIISHICWVFSIIFLLHPLTSTNYNRSLHVTIM